jgi:Ca-activated chloride channel homolog
LLKADGWYQVAWLSFPAKSYPSGTSMTSSTIPARLLAFALGVVVATAAGAKDSDVRPCTEDAMIVFDASGSMAGDGWGYGSESAGTVSRIDKVRSALREILPSITRFRRVGLLTYGSGAWNQCTIQLALKPQPNAADQIMAAVDALRPAGRTPLTDAVAQAADALDFRHKPGLIVVLTDGEETCDGSPCDMSEKLHAEADQLTIHVIGLRVKNYTWIGDQGILDAKCLAEKNGGQYLPVDTLDGLRQALEKTLGCPMVTDARASLR